MRKMIRRKVLEMQLEELAAKLRYLDSCSTPDTQYRDTAIDLYYLARDILDDSRKRRDTMC